MARLAAYALLAGALLAQGSAAQTGPDLAQPGGMRPFAEPLHWLNATPPDRLPLRERPMISRAGLAGAAPPRNAREGIVSSAGIAAVSRGGDAFPALSFGASYVRTYARWDILADYGAEVTDAPGSGRGIDTQGGFLSLSYRHAPRSRAGFVLTGTSSEDLQGGDAAQRLADGATRLDSTSASGKWSWDAGQRSGVEFGLAAGRQVSDAAGTPVAARLEASAAGWVRTSPRGRIDGRLRVAGFDLQPGRLGEDATHDLAALRMGYTADLGPRRAASGHVDLLAMEGDRFWGIGGTVGQTWMFARLSFGLDRDVTAVAGLADLVLTDAAEARLEMRLDRGVLANVALTRQRLEPLGSDREVTQVTAIEGQLSWALGAKAWGWTRLRQSRENAGGTRRDDTRLVLGLSRNLDF